LESTTPSSQEAFDRQPRFGYLPQLDGFRGLCIALVLIGHTFLSSCSTLGGLGVMMFFVLSGFLITGLLANEEEETGTISLKDFYARRALRILPAFLVFISIISLLIKCRLVTDVPWYTVVVACVYLSNVFGRGETIAHLWSLSLEEQFYAIWPAVFRRLRRRGALRFACGSVLIISSLRAASIILSTSSFYFSGRVYERPWFRFDSILVGCVISLSLLSVPKGLAVLVRHLPPIPIFLGLVSWTVLGQRFECCRPFYLTIQMGVTGYLLFSIVEYPTGLAAKLCCTLPLRWLGRISYSVYLWQQIFLISRVPSWGVLRQFPVNVICALVAGVISHYVVEQPFLRLKARLQKSTVSTPTTVETTQKQADKLSAIQRSEVLAEVTL
jgi:peptidoglycan/LPS O-acetylase OafA/YrhL